MAKITKSVGRENAQSAKSISEDQKFTRRLSYETRGQGKSKSRYAVLRENGRIADIRKLNKRITKEQISNNLKQNNSLYENKIRVRLTNFTEVTVFGNRAPNRSALKAQYVVHAQIEKGKIVTARSDQMMFPLDKKEMKEQAYQRFYGLFSEAVLGDRYDPKAGEDLVAKMGRKVQIREGFVFYKKI